MLLVFYIAIVVPFRLAFKMDEDSKFLQVINAIINISFAIDLVLNFFTSYYDENK